MTNSTADKEKQLKDLQAAVKKLEGDISTSKEDLAKIKEHAQSADKIVAKVQEFEKKVSSKENEVNDKKGYLAEFNKVVNGKTLLDQLSEAKNELAKSKKELDRLEEAKGVKKDSPDTIKSLGLKLDLLRSDHMLAGRWFVDDVIAGSPIAKAGIEINDVLMKIAKEDVVSANPSLAEIEAKLKKFKAGDSVDLQFYREHMGGFLKLDVVVVLPKA